jgi:hypothetical protein
MTVKEKLLAMDDNGNTCYISNFQLHPDGDDEFFVTVDDIPFVCKIIER